MASTYPGALDTMLDPAATLAGPDKHSDIEIKQNDALRAVQQELGTDPAGAFATVAARLTDIESQLTGFGSPVWTTFTPSFQGINSLSSSYGRYMQLGDIVLIFAHGTVQTMGTAAIALFLPLDAPAEWNDIEGAYFHWHLKTNSGNRFRANSTLWVSNQRAEARRSNDAGTAGTWHSTAPTTWGPGDEVTCTGFYQAAV